MSKEGITEELRRRIAVNKCAAIERKRAKAKGTQEPEEQASEAGAYKGLACEQEDAKWRNLSCFDEEYQDVKDPWETEEEEEGPPEWGWHPEEEEGPWAPQSVEVAVCPRKQAQNEFDPAEEFSGRREGMVFKKGPWGLGYYVDLKPSVLGADETQEKHAIKLKLSVLIPDPVGKEELSRPRRRRRRPHGGRRKPRKRRSAVDMSHTDLEEASAGCFTWEGASVTSSRSQETSAATDVDMRSVATLSGHNSEGSDDPNEDGIWPRLILRALKRHSTREN